MIQIKFRQVTFLPGERERFSKIYSEKITGGLKRASKKAAGLIADRIRKNILEGKRYDGRNVAKILPSTIRKKQGDTRPLVHTLTLYKAIDVKELQNSYKVYVKPLKGRFTSRTPRDIVARYLQGGTSKMKARPFFGATKKFINTLDKEFKKAFA